MDCRLDHGPPESFAPALCAVEEAKPVRDGGDRAGKAGVPSVAILDWHRQKLHLAENAEPEEQSAV